jgi:hypothetical protein
MSDPTHEVKEGHPPTYTLLQLRFRGKGIARIVSRDEYNMLKKSGMLWEFYPDAPMEWPTGQDSSPAVSNRTGVCPYNEALEHLKREYLRGTTCYHHGTSVAWTSEDGRFVLMLHPGHTEYIGGYSGSCWCGTHRDLFDLENLPHDLSTCFGDSALRRFTGRWKKEYDAEVQDIIAGYNLRTRKHVKGERIK